MKLAALVSLTALMVAMIGQLSAADAKGPLDFKVDSIEGKPVDLSQYKGQVVMIVNVASKCGLTPQYKQLEEVYTKYKDKGLVVLGFPANQFISRSRARTRKSPSSARASTTSTFRCSPRWSSRAKASARSISS